MNYTPGPWSISPLYPKEIRMLKTGLNGFHIRIGIVADTDQHSKGEAEANAKLIAAAPDLLDALLMVRRECNLDEWPDAEGYINAAIKKAIG